MIENIDTNESKDRENVRWQILEHLLKILKHSM